MVDIRLRLVGETSGWWVVCQCFLKIIALGNGGGGGGGGGGY